jgi:prepilin-type N-terminal cleavage/methylation domain-containing protein
MKRPGRISAFSLIEVIAAVAIFAIGMVAVLGLFAPVTKSIASVSDAEAAARVADAVRARLQTLPFEQALALVQEVAEVRAKDADGSYNPNDGEKYPAVIFGKLSGDDGIYDSSEKVWLGSEMDFAQNPPKPKPVTDADKFFEIDLIRNETLSPKIGNDEMAALVVFTMRVRWPAFRPASSGAAVQVGANPGGGGPVPFDHGRKQVLFFNGSIRR